MLFNRINYQVVLLLILSLVGWNRPSTPAVDCIRDQAKVVRTIINKKILPILYRYSVSMPEDCPFYHGYDLFGWHERHKYKFDTPSSTGWKCGLCGKQFSSEKDLDLHFDQVHSGDNDLKNKSVCLADYCDIMRCDVFESRLVISQNSSVDDDFLLPSDQTDEPDDWNRKCKEELQTKLRTKCKAIVKDCLSGLLIELSVQDFQDIQDDLNNAICSYLTCHRYWEYSLYEVRYVPALFYLVIGAFLAGGIGIWYYLACVLFETKYHIPSSGWCLPKRRMFRNDSLSVIRDRTNRQERCAPAFPPRIPQCEYKALSIRNRQFKKLWRCDYLNDEYLLRYSRKYPSQYLKEY
ncbi:Uncharacterised protein g5323 [Pycnogonum litorale]